MSYYKEVQQYDRGKAYWLCVICSTYTISESHHFSILVPMSDIIKGFITKVYNSITLIFQFIALYWLGKC